MIRAQFVLGRGFSSKVIAYFGAGGYSHVDIVLPNGDLLGARSDWIRPRGDPSQKIPPGVRIRPPDYELWDKQVMVSISCTKQQTRDFYDFVLAQEGKPYDSTAIWGFAFGRDWRADDSWYCSEVYSAGLEVAFIVPKLCAPTNKITPGGAMLISTAVRGRMRDMKVSA